MLLLLHAINTENYGIFFFFLSTMTPILARTSYLQHMWIWKSYILNLAAISGYHILGSTTQEYRIYFCEKTETQRE
jgi:hypothetical protein